MSKCYRTDTTWILELDDDEWYGKDHASIIIEAATEARKLGCIALAIFSIPDPVFPMNGMSRKHRVHYEKFTGSPERPYNVEARFVATVDAATWASLGDKAQMQLTRRARDDLNRKARGVPGRYSIVTSDGREIERGKV